MKKFRGLVAGFCLAAGMVMQGGSVSAEPFNPSEYAYRMRITFTNFVGRGTLTNFPVLIRFNTDDNFYAGFSSTNGYDLRFDMPDSDGALNHDIDTWNTTGESFVWVQMTNFTQNSVLWAYWGNEDAEQPASATNGATWSGDYIAVWHMNETNTVDAANNAKEGRTAGVLSVSTNATIGSSLSYSGGNGNGVLVTNEAGLFSRDGMAPFTASAWMKAPTISEWSRLIDQGLNGTDGWALALHRDNFTATLGARAGRPQAESTTVLNDNAWHHVVGTYDGSNLRIFIDGELEDTTASAEGPNVGSTELGLGANPTGGESFVGLLDEARVSSVARSTNWVWASYQNQGTNHFSFVTYGSAGAAPGTVIILR